MWRQLPLMCGPTCELLSHLCTVYCVPQRHYWPRLLPLFLVLLICGPQVLVTYEMFGLFLTNLNLQHRSFNTHYTLAILALQLPLAHDPQQYFTTVRRGLYSSKCC